MEGWVAGWLDDRVGGLTYEWVNEWMGRGMGGREGGREEGRGRETKRKVRNFYVQNSHLLH